MRKHGKIKKHYFKNLFITSDESAAKEVKYSSPYYKDKARLEKQLTENNDPIKTDLIIKELLTESDDKIIC